MVAAGQGRIGHRDSYPVEGIVDADVVSIQCKDPISIIERQRHAINKKQSLDVECGSSALVNIGLHVQLQW